VRQRVLQDKNIGIIFGVFSAVCTAVFVTTNKHIYANYDISALEYSLVFVLAGALFGISSLLTQINKPGRELLKNNYGPLLALGFVSAIAEVIFTIGQYYTTAVNTSLLTTSGIVITALFSHLLLKERHNKYQYSWMILLFIGLYIGVVGLKSIQIKSGDLIVLCSVVLFSFGNAYSRLVMKRMGSARLVPDVRLTIAGIVALIASVFVISDLSLILEILPFVLIAGLFFWLSMKTFAKAIYLINANDAIVLNNSQIFFTSAGGVMILSESYSLEKFIGSVMVITAIYFIAGRNR
jgi:drug/metabolite transporter (DMT)-like permease